MPLPSFAQDLGHGIYLIDTGFQRPDFDAAYLMLHGGRAAFVDTGTNHAVPRLLATLEALGLPRDAVDYVIPTHVHLDHAGGAGLLMRSLPSAKLLVHPRGARHMIDPTALYQGALAVYGAEEMQRSYGELVPVPADRVLTSHDNMALDLAGRPLALIDTPGHARHHHAVWDSLSRGWFTGDTFGLSYRELDTDGRPWILPATTPVQFEPEALRASIARLLAADPACVYLTHYGRLGDVATLAHDLLAVLDEVVALGLSLRMSPDRHQGLEAGLSSLYLASLRRAGSRLAEAEIAGLLGLDIELNAKGMGIWLDRLPAPHKG
ncbi:MAG TPA: MBL fold metallo-hydrolase [Ideonella sp.]|nr:MBL fold metallo-hydrolase [Ideonella sp.]